MIATKIYLPPSNKNHPKQWHTFPGLTYELISQHLPPSMATYKGHMIRTRQGTRSTRNNRQEVLDARLDVADMFPREQVCSVEEDEMFCVAVLGDSNDNTIYSDLAGRFPQQSYSGMEYVFVAYVYKINDILLRSMKSREDSNMVAAFQDIYAELEAKNLKPKLHVLDNECSRAVQAFLRSNDTKWKNVEAYNHRVHAAEPAVKTAKYHAIAHFATLDFNYPIQIWDRMLPTIECTLNLLRKSRRNNKISVYEELNGAFDWNATPLAPLGTKGVAFIDPEVRATWAPHCNDVFVTGMCPNHYRLLEFFDPKTRNYRKTGTYQLFPTHTKIPTISEDDLTIHAATDLLHSFRKIVPRSAKTKAQLAKAVKQLTSVLTHHLPTKQQ